MDLPSAEAMTKGKLLTYGFSRALLDVGRHVGSIVRKDRASGPTYDELVTGSGPVLSIEGQRRAAELSERPRRALPAQPLEIRD